LQFISLLQPAVLLAILHLETFYTTDGANNSNDFSEVVIFFKHLVAFLAFAFECIGLAALLIVQKAFVPQSPSSLLAGLQQF